MENVSEELIQEFNSLLKETNNKILLQKILNSNFKQEIQEICNNFLSLINIRNRAHTHSECNFDTSSGDAFDMNAGPKVSLPIVEPYYELEIGTNDRGYQIFDELPEKWKQYCTRKQLIEQYEEAVSIVCQDEDEYLKKLLKENAPKCKTDTELHHVTENYLVGTFLDLVKDTSLDNLKKRFDEFGYVSIPDEEVRTEFLALIKDEKVNIVDSFLIEKID